MSKNILTEAQQRELRSHKAVKSCTDRYITYSTAFKIHAVDTYQEGVSPYEIFTDAGIYPPLVTKAKMKESVRRWKRIVNTKGIEALKERASHHRRKKGVRGMTDKERIKYLELENELLRAEKDFLVRRRAQLGLD